MPTRKTGKTKAKRVAETVTHGYGAVSNETWISASEFKARCLELMDGVNDRHDQIVITKRGANIFVRNEIQAVPLAERSVDSPRD